MYKNKHFRKRILHFQGMRKERRQQEDDQRHLLLQVRLLVPWSDPLHQGMLRMQVSQFYQQCVLSMIIYRHMVINNVQLTATNSAIHSGTKIQCKLMVLKDSRNIIRELEKWLTGTQIKIQDD